MPQLGLPLSQLQGTTELTRWRLGQAAASQASSDGNPPPQARLVRPDTVVERLCLPSAITVARVSSGDSTQSHLRVRLPGSSVQAQTGAHRPHRWRLSPPSSPHILWQAGRGQYPECGRRGTHAAARSHMRELDVIVWTKAVNHQRCDRLTGTTMHPIHPGTNCAQINDSLTPPLTINPIRLGNA